MWSDDTPQKKEIYFQINIFNRKTTSFKRFSKSIETYKYQGATGQVLKPKTLVTKIKVFKFTLCVSHAQTTEGLPICFDHPPSVYCLYFSCPRRDCMVGIFWRMNRNFSSSIRDFRFVSNSVPWTTNDVKSGFTK